VFGNTHAQAEFEKANRLIEAILYNETNVDLEWDIQEKKVWKNAFRSPSPLNTTSPG